MVPPPVFAARHQPHQHGPRRRAILRCAAPPTRVYARRRDGRATPTAPPARPPGAVATPAPRGQRGRAARRRRPGLSRDGRRHRRGATSITLSTYIFDNDRAGQVFVDALAAAQARGRRGPRPDRRHRHALRARARGRLRRRGVPRAVPAAPLRSRLLQPAQSPQDPGRRRPGRLHRRHEHPRGLSLGSSRRRIPKRDLHFAIEGPVVAHCSAVRRRLGVLHRRAPPGEPGSPRATGARSSPAASATGPTTTWTTARVVLLGALLLRAVGLRRHPLLPARSRLSGAEVAALRGVRVDIVLPERNNLRFVQWAATASSGGARRRLRVWLSPPPFDHTKLDDRRRRVDAVRLGQLGPAQPAPQLRVRRRVLRPALALKLLVMDELLTSASLGWGMPTSKCIRSRSSCGTGWRGCSRRTCDARSYLIISTV